MPVFRTQNSGYFLNIASISGSTTAPGQAIYSATKAALILLTEAVDAEGRDFNVRATAVCAPRSSAARRASRRRRSPPTAACANMSSATAS